MKKILMILVFGISAANAAGTYHCNIDDDGYSDNFGEKFTAIVGGAKIKLTHTMQGVVNGVLDTGYTPRKNIGGARYFGSVNNNNGTGCDHVQITLNKNMASGKNGKLTMIYNCDSDGGAPMFIPYICRL